MFTFDHVGPKVTHRTPGGFDDRPYDRFAVAPLTPTIGAEVSGVALGGELDDELLAELRRALLEWKVLFFRDQDLTRAQHRAFAAQWGELEQHPFFRYTQPGQTEADVVTLAKDAQTAGYENIWHHDITWHTTPSFGAVLRAVEVPDVGGDTLWADAAGAYDLLPEDLRCRLDGLEAEHDWRFSFGLGMEPEVVEELSPQFPPVVHPVVRVHPETGRRGLFVNRIFTQRIVGVEPEESSALLERCFAQYELPEAQCRFRWTPGAVAFWDNRATLHYAANDYHPQRRVMDRISIVGDRPYGPS